MSVGSEGLYPVADDDTGTSSSNSSYAGASSKGETTSETMLSRECDDGSLTSSRTCWNDDALLSFFVEQAMNAFEVMVGVKASIAVKVVGVRSKRHCVTVVVDGFIVNVLVVTVLLLFYL